MSFELTTLGEYASIQGGYAYKSNEFSANGAVPVLKIKNIRHGFVDYSDVSYVSNEAAENTNKWLTQEGDVLISMTGSGPSAPESLVGRVARTWQGEKKSLINQRVGRLFVKDENKINKDFLYYLLSLKETQNYLVANSTGSANQVNISNKIIESIPCPKISFEESKSIASFLNGFESRLRNLRETNITLEAIAQALFKSWFVDFDPVHAKQQGRTPEGMDAQTAALFPDSFEESELGMVPKGWLVAKVSEVADVVKGKSYSSKDLVEGGSTALVTLKSFERGGGFRMDGFKPYIGNYKPSQVVNAGDLIIAYTDVTQAAELIGKPAIVIGVEEYSVLVASLDVGVVRPNSANIGKQFLYGLFKTEDFQSHTLAHTSGTTVLHLAKDGVGSFSFVLPPAELVLAFEKIADAVSERIQTNIDSIRTLASVRDTLLPRLISGQLRLPEAQALVEDAVDA